MKFDQLAYSTPQNIRGRASSVQVAPHGQEFSDALGMEVFTFRTWSRGTPYVSWVSIEEDGNTYVSCSCPYFMYNLEVALNAVDSGIIYWSNGAYPSVRNPFMNAFLCKHLYRLWQLKGLYNIRYVPPEEELLEEEIPEETLEEEIPEEIEEEEIPEEILEEDLPPEEPEEEPPPEEPEEEEPPEEPEEETE